MFIDLIMFSTNQDACVYRDQRPVGMAEMKGACSEIQRPVPYL